MHSKITLLFYVIPMLLFISSCEVINTEEPIPSYISIEKIELEHEKSIGITDAWVYVNTNLIGVFELPAQIPVLESGSADIMISPGIKVNGISATRTFYPFYKSYKVNKELKHGELTTISPLVGYDYNYTNIAWRENFEGTELKFEHDTSLNFFLVKDETMNFEGNRCGLIALDSTTTVFEEVSIDELAKPENTGRGMYLEMNFSSDMYFAVVIYVSYKGQIYPVDLVDLNPTGFKWKKIYLDLYTPLSDYPVGTKYKIAINNIDYIYGVAMAQPLLLNPKIYLDDIKIIQ